jgi:hypothetical protein
MLQAKFVVLRQILLDLGFQMQADAERILFEHPDTKARFLYPPYADDEEVYAGDLVSARYLLDAKGFLTRERFEELLRQKLVAG